MFAHEPPFRPRKRQGPLDRHCDPGVRGRHRALCIAAALRPASNQDEAGHGGGCGPLRLELPRDPQRRKLSSGNELFELSGKVVNPSNDSQRVPDIVAELRDKHNKAVYRWTITPPKRTIGPKQTLDFDAAEIDVPSGAHKLALSFAPQGIG